MSHKTFKKVEIIKKTLLLAGLALIIVGLMLTLIFNVILAPCLEKHLTISSDPEFTVWGRDVEIDSILFTPKPQYDIYANRPAIVLVHGFMSSNVYWRGTAFELTKRGFVCMTITARGHSASGGQFGPSWENETLSAVKYLRAHNQTLRIDPNMIGIVGHSMGAFSVTKAAIMDSSSGRNWINATVAVGGPYLNISNYFGDGFKWMLLNPFLYSFPLFDGDAAIENIIFEGSTSNSTPVNYLNIIGQFDEVFSVASAYELVYGMADTNYWSGSGISNANEIVSGHQYGNFTLGTARKLVVEPLVDHVIEGFVSTTSLEIINWFEDSMKLTTKPGYTRVTDAELITVELMSFSPVLAAIGCIVILLPATIYFGNWLRKKHEIIPEEAVNIEKRDLWKLFLVYGGLFIGIATITVPIIIGMNLLNFVSTDFLASSLLSAPYFVQGLLLIPTIIALLYFEKKKYNEKISD
ncbi:MAG: alpha/beta hydrolase family protein, partial [Candidatus Helarchaeota archaeon]